MYLQDRIAFQVLSKPFGPITRCVKESRHATAENVPSCGTVDEDIFMYSPRLQVGVLFPRDGRKRMLEIRLQSRWRVVRQLDAPE